MQLSVRGAQRTRDMSKKLPMYSKQWTPGDTLRVFYPIFWQDGRPEIAVGAIYGHSVSDIKGLGLKTSFIPSLTEFDEDKNPIGPPDITYQFSQIAPIFITGMKKLEEQTIMQKPWPTESARKEALAALETKYDTKNNQKAVQPIIQRVQYYISTEVVSVKIANNKPVTDTITISSAPLSNRVIGDILKVLDDPKFTPAEGESFLEVEWKYGVATEKGESAKNAHPTGVAPEYKLCNTDPDVYNIIKGEFDRVATDCEMIVRHATRTVDPNRVKQAIQQYVFMNSQYLDCADEEDVTRLCKSSSLMQELDCIRAIQNVDIISKLNAAIAESNAIGAQLASSTVPQPEIPPQPANASAVVPGTPTVPDIPDVTQYAAGGVAEDLQENKMNAQQSTAQQAAPAQNEAVQNGQPDTASTVPPLNFGAGAPNLEALLAGDGNIGALGDLSGINLSM